MINIHLLSGKITIHHIKRLYTHGRYERRMVLSCQNDREFCDLTLTREEADKLITSLQMSLSRNDV